MKTFIKVLLLVAIFGYSQFTLIAQDDDDANYYYTLDYMKVAPANVDDYLALEKVWKKIHESKIKAGHYIGWELTKVLSPKGFNLEYDYITRTSFKGEQQLAANFQDEFSMDNISSILTKEELALVERTSEIRDWVKSETWFLIDEVLSEDAADTKIQVFNYFDLPKGKTRDDHIGFEIDIWKPIHKARIERDDLEGWVLLGLLLPFGSDMPYQDASVDIYHDMNQYLSSQFPTSLVEELNPGKDIDELLTETRMASDLVKGEIRMRIDWVKLELDD